MFTDGCSSAESAARALQMQQTEEDKLHVQNNVEKISAAPAEEPKTSASIQRDDEKQRNTDHPLTSDK